MADTQPIFGLSDEQIQALQQSANQNQAAQIAQMGLPGQGASLYYRNLAGQQIGQAISGAMGYQDPMVQRNNLLRQAQQLTDVQARAGSIASMTPEYMQLGAQNLDRLGLKNEALHAMQLAQDMSYKMAETTNKNASSGKLISDTNQQNYKLGQEQDADKIRKEIDDAVTNGKAEVPPIMGTDEKGNTIQLTGRKDPMYSRALMYIQSGNPLLRQEGQTQLAAWLDQNSKNKELKEIPAIGPNGQQLFNNGEPMVQNVLVDKITGKTQTIGGPGVKQPGVRVNNVNTPTSKLVEGMDMAHVEIYKEQLKAAQAAPTMRDLADRLDDLTKKGTYSGTFADAQSGAATFFNSIGIPVDMSKTANTAELQSLINETIRGNTKELGTGNGFTNQDLVFLQKTLPQVGTSEQARKQVANLLRQRALSNEARFQTTLKAFKASGIPTIGANELLGGNNAVNPLPSEITSKDTGLPTSTVTPDMSGKTVIQSSTNPLVPTISVDEKGRTANLPGDKSQYKEPPKLLKMSPSTAPDRVPYKTPAEVSNAYVKDYIDKKQMQRYMNQLYGNE